MASTKAVITVGCKLPHGPVFSSGTPGAMGYRFIALNGGTARAPGLTVVPTELARAWFKANAALRHVKDKSVYIAEV